MPNGTSDTDPSPSLPDEPEHQRSDHSAPLPERLAAMKQTILSRRPILGQLLEEFGNATLRHYTKRFLQIPPTPGLTSRKWDITGTVHQLLEERLGVKVADSVSDQLMQLPLVSTTDHHGPIDHPFFVNANLISAIPLLENERRGLDHLIVFSFASVSVNNASAYPRGILFHGGENGEGQLIRLPILPDKVKMGVVYGMRPMTREELDRSIQNLLKKVTAGLVSPERAEKIKTILEHIFGSDDVLNAKDFASQISIINHRLWPQLLNSGHLRTKPYDHVPGLIYLEIETLVTELLLQHHLDETTSPLHQLMFNPKYRAEALKQFNNIPGAFSTDHDWGTFLFWALDEKLRRVRLLLDGDQLRSPDGAYTFALTPDAIAQALREKKIFPSMLVCYLIISLYYGMKCLGGFSQVHDLTLTKKAWQKLLRNLGNAQEATAIDPVETATFGGDGLVLSYIKSNQRAWQPATGIDMAINTTPYMLKHFVDLAKRVKLMTMMEPMLPEMYQVLYSQDQREERFADITPEDIIKINGLENSIRSVYEPTKRNPFVGLSLAITRHVFHLAKRLYGTVR